MSLPDLETLEPIRTLGGSRGLLFGGAGTADGSLFAISGGDRVAAIYDVASGVQLGGPITVAPDERSAVRLSIDGRWLAVGGQPTAVDDVVVRRGELTAGVDLLLARVFRISGRVLLEQLGPQRPQWSWLRLYGKDEAGRYVSSERGCRVRSDGTFLLEGVPRGG